MYNAIVWQCRRTAPLVDELLKTPGMADYIRENTGLVPDAYFSATKIKWILENVPGAREKAEAGELLFGTVDTWLVWKLTGGKVHVTDRTNASRTMLYNIRTLDWDEKLLQALDIPRCILPEVRDSSEIYGYTNIQGVDVPVAGIAGDQQAALFGQGCFKPGDVKNTYGTGCFLLMNTGKEIYQSKNGLVTTVAISLNGEVEYALEGSVFVGGAVIQWIRDGMHMIQDSCDSEYYAQKVPDNGGVYIVPAFTGLGAPYWDMYARGAILGITRGTTQNHIIRAAEESIAYQSADLMWAMEKDTDITISTLKVDGGASRDHFLMQFQSDILNKEVLRPAIRETTALGAAYLFYIWPLLAVFEFPLKKLLTNSFVMAVGNLPVTLTLALVWALAGVGVFLPQRCFLRLGGAGHLCLLLLCGHGVQKSTPESWPRKKPPGSRSRRAPPAAEAPEK